MQSGGWALLILDVIGGGALAAALIYATALWCRAARQARDEATHRIIATAAKSHRALDSMHKFAGRERVGNSPSKITGL
jgi:hypothetical protein